ncbi:MAG TPA: ATP-binding protein [Candidatus Saccharimonadales bacterium]|nr:ATP-binding protein [Candidatus Saccharimonadales bacterium]
MEHLKKATDQIRGRVWLMALIGQLGIGFGCWGALQLSIVSGFLVAIFFVVCSALWSFLVGWSAGFFAQIPLEALGKSILHVSPSENSVGAPKTEDLRIGREYVTNLVYQLYQVASLQDNKLMAEHKREATQASDILNHLPLPLFVFNKQQVVTFGSEAALAYCGLESSQLFGKPLFDAVDLEFPNDFTLESWVKDCQDNKVTDSAYWRRVRLRLKDDSGAYRQCDMAGYYNRDSTTGIEFIVTLFDRTQEYAQDDQSLSFIALAVHELRTPLTMMRGYIEVFEEELEGKLDAELTGFMHQMHAAAQQLAAFVNNILNVARIEGNQLTVKLGEESWDKLVRHAGEDMAIRGAGQGKTISYDIQADLPSVAADRVTIYEVICNLLDNALKYSGTSKDIKVKAYKTKDGLVETTVEDKGVGIPTSVIPSLFEKFHRNHRNKAQVSGTGLGLYLSKAIVNAHGGDIWVKSKEGQGTTVGFTLKPYSMLADELKSGNNKDDMVRTAHGWIKNHSLYRR